MENETVIVPPQQPSLNAEPTLTPPAPTNTFKPKSRPKLLYIFGGLAVIVISIALSIVFFGPRDETQVAPTSTSDSSEVSIDPSWPKFANPTYFYELGISPKWSQIKRSPNDTNSVLFNLENTATLEITAQKTTTTLDDYLVGYDETNKDLVKSKSSTQVKVGVYDGYERAESWPSSGLQVITSYVKISDMLYTFALIPAGSKNAITNDSIIRDYHASLSSFRLTDTSMLGVDLKEYTSKKVEGLAFVAFSLKYPQSWALSEKVGDKSLDISIYRNNYEITISQKSIGGAVCLFSDSPAFEGSSGDLRSKQFAEFNTTGGKVLRRYFNANAGDKSTMFFCQRQEDGPYFETPLTVGGLVYYVPAKYDADIIKEMDDIVKSITTIQ